MASERQLSEVLSEFARTMVTDFSIQDILDRLVERIVEIMPVERGGGDTDRARRRATLYSGIGRGRLALREAAD